MDIIKRSLEYYDKNNEQFEVYMSKVKYYKYISAEGDIKRNIIKFYNANKKEIYKSKIEHMGLYHNQTKLWAWAWANPLNFKNVTYLSKKVFDYGMNMDPKKENLFLRMELLTSRFRITSSVQLDMHVALSAYLTKIPYIFKMIWYPEKSTSNKDQNLLEYKPDIEISTKYKQYQIRYIYILDHDKLKI
uniref:Uncharacterized protein n=1 Tax=Mimivirus LCMiAC02 TaxID=2506609 RepID=A0A481Z2A2_9VIRU|nr:MAG: uncharacterized protein LCMiAC02_00070 [Mimivirus LCMiAC02]